MAHSTDALSETGVIFTLFTWVGSAPQMIAGHELPLSTVGYALSDGGIHFKDRRQFIKPEYDWEQFGCEDPRVTKMDGKFYIFYTALSAFPFTATSIRVGVAITQDFQKIDEKHPVTPFNAKAMSLFPEKIKGRHAHVLITKYGRSTFKDCSCLTSP